MADALMSAVPELLDAYAAKATGVADALTRQAGELAAAVDRFTASTNRSALPGPLPDPTRYRELAGRVADLGNRAGTTAAAVRTADTTPQVDLVFMPQTAFEQARARVAPPPPGPAPAAPPPQPGSPPLPSSAEGWRRLAYERIGIDPARWDAAADMRTNDAAIRAIWDRYGELYLSDPQHLWWAGMAKLGGSTVYAGMMDLKTMADLPDDARAEALRQWIERLSPGVSGEALARLAATLTPLSSEQLNSFVVLFQRMQKAIADDLLWQHEAYRARGIPGLLPHLLTGRLHLDTYRAWLDIASGKPARVSQGNRALLEHEQRTILPRFYDELRSTPAGTAFAELITLTTESPIPGGRAYRDVMVARTWPIPGLDPEVPFPRAFMPGPLGRVRGNIADKDDRWEWITRDMWPAHERLLAQDPARMDQLMHTPVRELADARRLVPLPYGP
jgi:hypothetical protein